MTIIGKKTKHPYIVINPKISGGQPVIKGTRIQVIDIAIKYEFKGLSADRIIDEYPHLKLEQVYDALSYYYEHKDAFGRKLKENNLFLMNMKNQYPSKLKMVLNEDLR